MIAGMLYPGYSFTSQAISELFAIGAPTSSLVVPLFTISSVFLLAFALGVWMTAGKKRSVSIMALMLAGNAINGIVLWNFFPMHIRGAEATFTDTMHIALAGAGASFALAVVGLGIAAFRGGFRFYTIGAMALILAPAFLTFLYIPQVALSQSTPWLGFEERISSYVYNIWQGLLVLVLLREQRLIRGTPT